jgi:hypothetical protein
MGMVGVKTLTQINNFGVVTGLVGVSLRHSPAAVLAEHRAGPAPSAVGAAGEQA